ncbi:MAG: hypothetical protein ACE5NA_05660 [Nitrospiraceae bacterium]
MCFVASLMPATMFAVIGYFVLFASTRAEGPVYIIGRVLAIWIFFLALMFPVMGAYVVISGLCPMEAMLGQIEAVPAQQ